MHAKLSPSSAHRWIYCPGSVALSDQAPEQEPSEYALEGTFAHSKAEKGLRDRKSTYLAPIKYNGESNQDLTNAVNFYLKFAWKLIKSADHYLIEQRVRFSKNIFGTADLIVLDEMLNTLVVVDYKHGARIPVDPINNPQLVIYGLASLNHLTKPQNYHYLSLVICQPRIKNGNKIKTWNVPIAELKEQWEPRIIRAIKRVHNRPDTYVVGSHCRWCPGIDLKLGNHICPEQQKTKTEQAKEMFE